MRSKFGTAEIHRFIFRHSGPKNESLPNIDYISIPRASVVRSPNSRKEVSCKLLIISAYEQNTLPPMPDIGGCRNKIGPTVRVGPMSLRLFGEEFFVMPDGWADAFRELK